MWKYLYINIYLFILYMYLYVCEKKIDIICMYIYIYYGRIYCTQNLIWEINEALGYLLKIIYDIIIIADTVYSKNTYIIIYIYFGVMK